MHIVEVCINGWIVKLPTNKVWRKDDTIKLTVNDDEDNDESEVWNGEVVSCKPIDEGDNHTTSPGYDHAAGYPE